MKTNKISIRLSAILSVMLLSLGVFFSACNNDEDDDNGMTGPTLDIVETAQGDAELSTLVAALQAADLVNTLKGPGPFTVFAPTNDAFANLPAGALNYLLDNPDELTKVLTYHVIDDEVTSDELTNGDVTTLNGNTISVDVSSGVVLNGSSTVTTADIEATNGVVHKINEVLIPDDVDLSNIPQTIAATAIANDDLSILVDILSLPALADILDAASDENAELTVFAPTNSAFEAVLTALGKNSIDEIPESVLLDIVQYHIVPSVAFSTDLQATTYETLNGESVTVTLDNDGVQVDGNNVVIPDIEATNGVVHVIDGVLLPSLYASAVGTVVEVPLFSKDYTILTEALVSADLVNTLLDTQSEFTVFAPDNAAFEAAGITSLEGLTSEDLTPILLYHVVGSEVLSTQLPERTVTTLGGDFFLSFVGEDVFINGNTQITAVDIQKSNGVIHTINRTLVPPTQTIVEIAQDNEDLSTLVSVLTSPDQSAVLEALTGEGPFTLFAPTNDAFSNISALIDGEGGDDLTAAQITEVLQYHVTLGRVYSTDLSDGLMPEMLNGETVTVNIGDNVTLTDMDGDAVNPNPTVIEVNINGTNGVIHIIDEVLIPDLNN